MKSMTSFRHISGISGFVIISRISTHFLFFHRQSCTKIVLSRCRFDVPCGRAYRSIGEPHFLLRVLLFYTNIRLNIHGKRVFFNEDL